MKMKRLCFLCIFCLFYLFFFLNIQIYNLNKTKKINKIFYLKRRKEIKFVTNKNEKKKTLLFARLKFFVVLLLYFP